jgi:hypothetical protein
MYVQTRVLVDSEWLRRKVDAVGAVGSVYNMESTPHGPILVMAERMATEEDRTPTAEQSGTLPRIPPAIHSQSHKFISALSCPVRPAVGGFARSSARGNKLGICGNWPRPALEPSGRPRTAADRRKGSSGSR